MGARCVFAKNKNEEGRERGEITVDALVLCVYRCVISLCV